MPPDEPLPPPFEFFGHQADVLVPAGFSLSGLWNNGQALDYSIFPRPEPLESTRGIIGSSLLVSGSAFASRSHICSPDDEADLRRPGVH